MNSFNNIINKYNNNEKEQSSINSNEFSMIIPYDLFSPFQLRTPSTEYLLRKQSMPSYTYKQQKTYDCKSISFNDDALLINTEHQGSTTHFCA
ncbi:unnamed protein product [Rotaria sp. Silwood1]|nr:unnamed protein product [Rotaria sp. Silwood1]CAF1274274.1 unnamed protein product [Rotaria sp. Silwood1]CAF3597752.1 unnamed protein product [Rotaria sp. Silwood1]CAF3671068.1 unnamed protein product [Rotaria sp. Silwood1]CAF5074282.1 unnamed protein product [Rotaria sp. Silwood1]